MNNKNNWPEIFEIINNGNPSFEEFTNIISNLEYDGSGNYYLAHAYFNDTQGLEEEAAQYYLKAKKLGFLPSELERWYYCFGSTLRWNSKYDESKEILEEGLKAFPDSEFIQGFLLITKHKLHELSIEELESSIKKIAPAISNKHWTS